MIKITCDCKHTRNIKDLEPFQGNIKSLSPKERAKLIRLIETYGLRFPFFVWGNKILNGHQRYDVLINDFKYNGLVPVVEIEAETENEAIELVLVSASQSGRFNLEELQEFTVNVSDVENFSLVDGPSIGLDFKVDITPNSGASIKDDIKIVDSEEYEQAEVEEVKLQQLEEVNFPDGTKLVVGEDRYFAEEVVRMWNSRNKTQKVVFNVKKD